MGARPSGRHSTPPLIEPITAPPCISLPIPRGKGPLPCIPGSSCTPARVPPPPDPEEGHFHDTAGPLQDPPGDTWSPEPRIPRQ